MSSMDALLQDPQRYNQRWLSRINEPGGVKTAQAAVRNYIQLRIRERGIWRNVMPPELVTAEDCTPHEDHDLLTKLVPRSYENTQAMAANFVGSHDGRYIVGDRLRAFFYKIETFEQKIEEGKILAFNYPVVEYIEKISVYDIEKAEDTKGIELLNAACTATGKIINSGATQIDRQVFNQLIKMINGDELEFDCAIMNKVDHDDWCTLPATVVGSDLSKEMTVNGYKYKTIQGYKLITTIKSDLVPPGTMFGITKPELLGVFYLLGDTRFEIRKEYDLIRMKAWEYLSMLIAQTKSACKLIMNVPNPLTGL